MGGYVRQHSEDSIKPRNGKNEMVLPTIVSPRHNVASNNEPISMERIDRRPARQPQQPAGESIFGLVQQHAEPEDLQKVDRNAKRNLSQTKSHPVVDKQGLKLKESVPKAHELNRLNDRLQRNYVKENYEKNANDLKPPSRHDKAEEEALRVNKNFGKVPNYLNRYKEQREHAI